MSHPRMLQHGNAVLVVIDIQEAFRHAIGDMSLIASRAAMAVRGFQILELPMIITEQYPKGLGRTAEEILFSLPSEFEVVEKNAFSACGSDVFLEKLNAACGQFRAPQEFNLNYQKQPFDLAKQEAELPRLRETLDRLRRDGRLAPGTTLAKELAAFADRLEARITKARAAADAKKADQDKDQDKTATPSFNPPRDTADTSATLKVLEDAIAARPTLRQLIHVSDVHRSVEKSMDKFQQTKEAVAPLADDDGIPEEREVTTSRLTAGYESVWEGLVGGASQYYRRRGRRFWY